MAYFPKKIQIFQKCQNYTKNRGFLDLAEKMALRQVSRHEDLSPGHFLSKVVIKIYDMLYLFLGQNPSENSFLATKIIPGVSLTRSPFSIHFSYINHSRFCIGISHRSVKKKINLPK